MIYHYSKDTNEFIKATEPRLDPIEGQPLIPAFATEIEPPLVPANSVAVFSGTDWIVYPDHRGTQYWEADHSEHIISNINELVPNGVALLPPPNENSILDNGSWRDPNAQEIDAEKTATSDIENTTDELLRAVVLVLFTEINNLRSNAGLQPRTIQQLKTAIKNRL